MIAVNLRLFGDVLNHSLQLVPDINVVYPGPLEGTEAVTLHQKMRPDVALVDYTLRGLDGPDTTREIRASSPAAKVLLLAGAYGPEDLERALSAGAMGFLPKSLGFDRLVEAIRACHGDRPVGSDQLADLADELRARMQEGDEQYARCASLKERDLEILRHLAEGRSTTEVARTLSMSVGTVKNHLTRILGTIDASSRREAIDMARRAGFLTRGRDPGM